MLVALGVVCFAGLVGACSGANDSGPLIPSAACVPGQQIACTCPGGAVGAQACNANGEGYGACAGCGTTIPGLDATAPVDDAAGPGLGDDGGPVVTGDDGGRILPSDDGGRVLPSDDGGRVLPNDDGGLTGNDGGPHDDAGEAHDAGGQHDAGDQHDASPPPPPVDAGPCNPAAFDFTGTCGTSGPCDESLLPDGGASAFAQALGICPTSIDATHWGLVSATYSSGHSYQDAGAANFDEQHGILPSFGSVLVPTEGATMGVLSSGSATATDSDTGPLFKGEKTGMQGAAGVLGTTGNTGDLPPGFPQTYPGCPAVSTILNDLIDVRLQIRVPTNASGFTLDFDFMSGDWPDYACSTYNDGFIAYLSSAAFNGGTPANMATDGAGNPVTINAPALPVCTAGTELGCDSSGTPSDAGTGTSICAAGPASLAGTGFAAADPAVAYCGSVVSTSGGGTGWLTSSAPVQPGEVITLELIIWDSGDASFDSSVLLDHFHWLQAP
jgi:hypothetical protein